MAGTAAVAAAATAVSAAKGTMPQVRSRNLESRKTNSCCRLRKTEKQVNSLRQVTREGSGPGRVGAARGGFGTVRIRSVRSGELTCCNRKFLCDFWCDCWGRDRCSSSSNPHEQRTPSSTEQVPVVPLSFCTRHHHPPLKILPATSTFSFFWAPTRREVRNLV